LDDPLVLNMEIRLTRLFLFLVAVAAPIGALEFEAEACIDPTEAPYGAIVNDGLDDRAAIQAAIDNACTLPVGERHVCLPWGRLHATRKPLVGAANIPSIKITCDDIEFSGRGMFSSTIAMLGTGIFPGQSQPGDWTLFAVREGAERVHVHHVHFDGSERVNTNEQTHLIRNAGPTTDVTFEYNRTTLPPLNPPIGTTACLFAPVGTTCANPFGSDLACSSAQVRGAWCNVSGDEWTITGWYHGGDCFTIIGEWPEGTLGQPGYIPDQVVRNTIWRSNIGPSCDRSWIALQRGHDNTQIIGGAGVVLHDATIDSEPTGGKGYTNLKIIGPYLSRGGEGGGGVTFSIGGSGSGVSTAEVDCQGRTISGGGTRVMDVQKVVFRNCTFDTGTISPEAPLAVVKRAGLLEVYDSVLRHPAGAPFQPGFVVRAQNGVHADDIKFHNVRIEQHVTGPVVDLSSARSFEWNGGEIVYTAAPWTGIEATAIIADSIVAPMDSVSISGVKVTAPAGSFAGLVRMGRTTTSTIPLGGILLTDIDIQPGAFRSYVARFNNGTGAALHTANITGAPMSGSVALLCGGGCPP
jgi:hypothetical protein